MSKRLVREVKVNSLGLEKEIERLIAEGHEDKWAVAHGGRVFVKDTLSEAYFAGIHAFGEAMGFAVARITRDVPAMSNLVAL